MIVQVAIHVRGLRPMIAVTLLLRLRHSPTRTTQASEHPCSGRCATIACDEEPAFGQPTYDDNCNIVTVTLVDTSAGDDCAGSYTRTWTATDACGNSAVASQTFTYEDNEAPTITAAVDETIECGDD